MDNLLPDKLLNNLKLTMSLSKIPFFSRIHAVVVPEDQELFFDIVFSEEFAWIGYRYFCHLRVTAGSEVLEAWGGSDSEITDLPLDQNLPQTDELFLPEVYNKGQFTFSMQLDLFHQGADTFRASYCFTHSGEIRLDEQDSISVLLCPEKTTLPGLIAAIQVPADTGRIKIIEHHSAVDRAGAVLIMTDSEESSIFLEFQPNQLLLIQAGEEKKVPLPFYPVPELLRYMVKGPGGQMVIAGREPSGNTFLFISDANFVWQKLAEIRNTSSAGPALFSLSGKLVAFQMCPGEVSVWNVASRNLIKKIEGAEDMRFCGIHFSDECISFSENGRVRIVKLFTEEESMLQTPALYPEDSVVSGFHTELRIYAAANGVINLQGQIVSKVMVWFPDSGSQLYFFIGDLAHTVEVLDTGKVIVIGQYLWVVNPVEKSLWRSPVPFTLDKNRTWITKNGITFLQGKSEFKPATAAF